MGRVTEENGFRRLTSESTPVEQGHDFATQTGTLGREELLGLSDLSIDNPGVGGSPTDKHHDAWVDRENVNVFFFVFGTSKEHIGNFPYTMGTG